MTENTTQQDSKPTSAVPLDRWIQRFYRFGVALLAIFVLISALVFVGRAAIYKIHAYERGLHLRGGRFVRVQEPGWHVQIPLVDTVIIVKVSERLGYVEQRSRTSVDAE